MIAPHERPSSLGARRVGGSATPRPHASNARAGLGPEERLLATCWSSAGDAASDRADLRSLLNLRERIEAASAAGFRGFGLLSADLPAAEQEYGLSGIRAMLDDNGMADLELEGIPYWWDDGPRWEESDRIRHDLLRAAEVLGARQIKVTPDGDDAPWDREHWAAKFAELAAQAQNAGTRLGIEFFPWSNIKTLYDRLQLVQDPDTPLRVALSKRGILSVLIPRSRSSHPFPLHRIIGVELNDADSQVIGTLFEDTVHRRRYCGEGVFDLTGMIKALRTASLVGPSVWRSSRSSTDPSLFTKHSVAQPQAPDARSRRLRESPMKSSAT